MGMTRDDVIKGLECHVKGDCAECPYREGWHTCNLTPESGLFADAIALLKAQEPRVMTLEEIGNALKMPLWKETKRAHKDLYTGWVLAYDVQKGLGITGTRLGMSEPAGRVVWYRLDDYGKTWRCWTSCPSEEQWESVKWD